jgi:hypothetical protein
MSDQGQLGLFTIGIIFAVVFAAMTLSLQGWKDSYREYDQPSDLEQRLRAHAWAAFDEARADRNLSDATRGSSPQTAAHMTAQALVERDYFENGTAVGRQPGQPQLPNAKGFCQQVPATVTVDRPDWNTTDGQRIGNETTRAVADHIVGLFADHDRPTFTRSNTFSHGFGVAVDGSEIYAVYRTCNLGY